MRHRRSLKELYTRVHAKRVPQWVSAALFGFYRDSGGSKVITQYPAGSVFSDVANLSKMNPAALAATIQKWHLDPKVVSGALAGAKAKQDDAVVVQATINQMSDTDVVKNAKKLESRQLPVKIAA